MRCGASSCLAAAPAGRGWLLIAYHARTCPQAERRIASLTRMVSHQESSARNATALTKAVQAEREHGATNLAKALEAERENGKRIAAHSAELAAANEAHRRVQSCYAVEKDKSGLQY